MRRLIFVKARIRGIEAEFLRSIAYNQGEAKPRRSFIPGDGLNKVQYMYSPENQVEFLVDLNGSAAFIREVKASERDESRPLELITAQGESVDAIPWEIDDGRNPVVIYAQPNDGRW